MLTDLYHGEDRFPTGRLYQPKIPASYQFPHDSKLNVLQALIDLIVTKKTMSVAAFEDCYTELFNGL